MGFNLSLNSKAKRKNPQFWNIKVNFLASYTQTTNVRSSLDLGWAAEFGSRTGSGKCPNLQQCSNVGFGSVHYRDGSKPGSLDLDFSGVLVHGCGVELPLNLFSKSEEEHFTFRWHLSSWRIIKCWKLLLPGIAITTVNSLLDVNILTFMQCAAWTLTIVGLLLMTVSTQ